MDAIMEDILIFSFDAGFVFLDVFLTLSWFRIESPSFSSKAFCDSAMRRFFESVFAVGEKEGRTSGCWITWVQSVGTGAHILVVWMVGVAMVRFGSSSSSYSSRTHLPKSEAS